MRRPLNLASRPFRNEALPALLFAVGCVLLLVLSLLHGVAVRRLLPGRTTGLHSEVAALEKEVAAAWSRSCRLRSAWSRSSRAGRRAGSAWS
jgi:hypothetical protein